MVFVLTMLERVVAFVNSIAAGWDFGIGQELKIDILPNM